MKNESEQSYLRTVPEMDGLRGIAIINVLFLHTLTHYFGQEGDYRLVGELAVPLFFAVSGFCIYWGILVRFQSGRDVRWNSFAGRRAHRIYPPYIIAAGIFFVKMIVLAFAAPGRVQAMKFVDIPHLHPSEILRVVFFNATLTQVFMGKTPPINPAFWSLSVEFQFYLIVCFLLYFYGKFGMAPFWWALTAIVASCGAFVVANKFGAIAFSENFWNTFFPNYVSLFALGSAFSWWRLDGWGRSRPSRNCSLVLFLTVVSTVALVSWGWVIVLLVGIGAGYGTLLPIMWVRIFLRWGPLRYLGERSYSIYLMHGLGIAALSRIGAGLVKKHGYWGMGVIPLTWAFAIGISLIFYQLVERHFLRSVSSNAQSEVKS